jgi:hypothetical protein
MDNLVQLPNVGWLSKSRLRQTRPIDAAVWIQNTAPKVLHHFLVNGFAGLHELVRNGIGLNEVGPESDEHLTYTGLTCRDPTRESDFQQRLDTSNCREAL